MLHPFTVSTVALALLALLLVVASTAVADDAGKKRCTDLVAFFDRWGSTRSEHTDGARNHTRIGAAIDCERGDYAGGIARMEALLLRKNFDVPREVGAAPMYEPIGRTALAAAAP